MIVADTDVLIDYLRRGGPADRVEQELRQGRLATTSITVYELWQGARTTRQTRAVEALLGACELLPLDPTSARRAGELRANLLRQGVDIGPTDCLVAGICLCKNATLLTRSRKHFARVPGLLLA